MTELHSTEVLAVVFRTADRLGLSKTWNQGAAKSLPLSVHFIAPMPMIWSFGMQKS